MKLVLTARVIIIILLVDLATVGLSSGLFCSAPMEVSLRSPVIQVPVIRYHTYILFISIILLLRHDYLLIITAGLPNTAFHSSIHNMVIGG
jgi:hypothetical protein